jgi:hypothetical protein
MTARLIRRDERVIGIAPHDAQGVGVLAWFHANVSAYSMNHATAHEGYSVDGPAELDHHDVESIVAAICERAGVTMEVAFVPFSQSRNAKPRLDGKKWESLNWRVTIKRHGREILTTDYAQGVGHAPAGKKTAESMQTAVRVMGLSASIAKAKMVAYEIETGRVACGYNRSHGVSGSRPIPAPPIGDVLQPLASDSDVLNYGGFDDWAADFGYDTDSRNAESIYRACVEIATKLRAGLGTDLLSEIRLAASYN